MENLFTKRIICSQCNGYFKRRKERQKYKWTCSKLSNGYSNCKRVVIEEEFLISVLEKRYRRKLTGDEIRNSVERIEIESKMLFTIYLTDQEPIIYSRNHIVY